MELNGYCMTNVSPVKKGNYFDMRLLSKTDTKRAVCFAVDRREEFCAYQAQTSSVKIKNFQSIQQLAMMTSC